MVAVLRTYDLHQTRDDDGAKHWNQYVVGDELGSGTSSRVFAASDQHGNARALKVFSKSRLRKQKQQQAMAQHTGGGGSDDVPDRCMTEIRHLVAISEDTHPHPNIVRLYEVIDSPNNDKIVLVLEYADLGELLSWDASTCQYRCVWSPAPDHPPFVLAESLARSCFRQLVQAVRYLHEDAALCHRDIKPANILIQTQAEGAEPRLLLSDFGVTERFHSTPPLYSDTTGTYAFMPPEACAGHGYDGRQADLWAVGVTLYSMALGRLPFYSANLMELFGRIQACDLDLPESVAAHPVADLLRAMLQVDAARRPTLDQILAHPWLNPL